MRHGAEWLAGIIAESPEPIFAIIHDSMHEGDIREFTKDGKG